VCITNSMGETVFRTSLQTQNVAHYIDISHLHTGIYYLSIGATVHRLVKY
jgi:hypothetical protein